MATVRSVEKLVAEREDLFDHVRSLYEKCTQLTPSNAEDFQTILEKLPGLETQFGEVQRGIRWFNCRTSDPKEKIETPRTWVAFTDIIDDIQNKYRAFVKRGGVPHTGVLPSAIPSTDPIIILDFTVLPHTDFSSHIVSSDPPRSSFPTIPSLTAPHSRTVPDPTLSINEELPLFPTNMDNGETQKEEFSNVLSQFTSHMDIEDPVRGLNFSDEELCLDLFEDSSSIIDLDLSFDIPHELQTIKVESLIKREDLEVDKQVQLYENVEHFGEVEHFEEVEDYSDVEYSEDVEHLEKPEEVESKSVILIKNEDIKEEDIDIETVSDSTITVLEAGDVTTLLEQFEATEKYNKISPIKLKCDPTTHTYVIQHQEKKNTNINSTPLKNSQQNVNVTKKKSQKAIQQENQLPNKQIKQQTNQQVITKVKPQTKQKVKKEKKQQTKNQSRQSSIEQAKQKSIEIITQQSRPQTRLSNVQQPHQTIGKTSKQPVIQQSKQQSHQTLSKQPKQKSPQHVIQQTKQHSNLPSKQQAQQQTKQQSNLSASEQSYRPVIQQSKQQSNQPAKQQSQRPLIQQSKQQPNQQSIEKIQPQIIHKTLQTKKQPTPPTIIQVKQHLFDQAIDQNIKLNLEATQRSKQQANQKPKSSTSKNIVQHLPKADYIYNKNDIPSRPLKSQEVSVQLDHAYCTPSPVRHIISPKTFYQSILSEYDKKDCNNTNVNNSMISQAKDDTRKDSGLESGEVSDASEEAHQNTSISIPSSNLTTVVVTKPSGLVSLLKRSHPNTISGVINKSSPIPTPTKTTVVVDTGPALSSKITIAEPKKRKLNLDEYRNRLKKRVGEDDEKPCEKNMSKGISIMATSHITEDKEKDESEESNKVSKTPDKEKTKNFRKSAIRKRNYRARRCSSDSNSSIERYPQRKTVNNSDSDSRRSTSQSSNSSRRSRSSSNSSTRYSKSRSRSRSSTKSSTRSYSRSRSRSRSRSYSRTHSRTRSRSKYRYRSRSRSRRYRYESSRSHSRSRSRSRSNSRFRSQSRDWIYRPVSRPSSALPALDRKEKQRQVEERRVVYVGRLEEGITRAELRTQFEIFGPIVDISIHFREHGDNYGFVTFMHKDDAYTAVGQGKHELKSHNYDLCFGGRRAFCRSNYADLDGMATSERYNAYNFRSSSPPRARSPSPTISFDYLLRQAKADAHRNTKKDNDKDKDPSNQL